MPQFLVWETEYPDEGSNLYDAADEGDAIRQYLAETGTKPDDAPDLSTCVATPEILEVRDAWEAVEEAQARHLRAVAAVMAESKR